MTAPFASAPRQPEPIAAPSTMKRPAGAHARGREAAVAAAPVHETYFFRHPRQFDFIAGTVLPALREEASRAGRAHVSAWCAACSTGEEAWTLALVAARGRGPAVRIAASDRSEAAVVTADRAVYRRQAVLGSFRPMFGAAAAAFPADLAAWSPAPGLRAGVRFFRHDMLDPAPAGPCDLLLCRNVLVHMTADARRVAFDRMADALRPGGYLALGTAETPGADPRFSPVGPPEAMMFRRLPSDPAMRP